MARALPPSPLREKILREAIGIVYREGPGRITMRRLAETLGYSPATIYLHFKNKDDLIAQIAMFGFDELLEAVQPALSIADPLEAVSDAGRRYVEFALSHREVYRLMFQEPLATEATHGDWQRGEGVWDLFRQLYRRGMDERVLRALDPDREIAIGWAMLHGFVQLAQSDRMPPFGLPTRSLPELREALLEERLRAIRA